MKRKLSFLLASVFIMFALPLQLLFAAADGVPILKAKDVIVKAGEIFEIPVSIENNSGIECIMLSLEYDTTKLRLIKATDSKLMSSAASTFGKDVTKVPYNMLWDDYCTENHTENGELAVLTFEALDVDSCTTEVMVSTVKKSTFDVNMKEVAFKCEFAEITIIKKYDENDAVISLPDTETQTGKEVELPVFIRNNPGFVALMLDVEYDSSVLELVSVEDTRLFATAVPTFTKDLTKQPYRLMWDDEITNINTENGKFAVLKFKVLVEEKCDTAVKINVNQNSTFDSKYKDVAFKTEYSTVKIEKADIVTTSTTETTTETITTETTNTSTTNETTTSITSETTSTTTTTKNTTTETTTAKTTTTETTTTTTTDTTTSTTSATISTTTITETTTTFTTTETTSSAITETTSTSTYTETTTNTAADTSITTATTTTSQTGKVIWNADSTTAKAGEEVTFRITVDNSDGSEIPVAAAQFKLDTALDIIGVSAEKNGYDAQVVFNAETGVFEFVSDGNVLSKDEAIVVELILRVPEDCKSGEYAVAISELTVLDEDGNDISGNVILEDGIVTVQAKSTTTTPKVTTTETTTAETTSDATTETTTSTTTDTTISTTSATTSTTTETTTTSTTTETTTTKTTSTTSETTAETSITETTTTSTTTDTTTSTTSDITTTTTSITTTTSTTSETTAETSITETTTTSTTTDTTTSTTSDITTTSETTSTSTSTTTISVEDVTDTTYTVTEINKIYEFSINNFDNVTAESSDEDIATVTVEDGKLYVTPSAFGSVEITLTDNDTLEEYTFTFTVEESKDFLLGDVDGDGTISAMDASAALTYYVMNPENIEDLGFSFNAKAADWDGNGVIDARDASAILTYYVSH